MSKEYPLFPDLPEAARIEAQNLIEQFKSELVKAADEAIGKLYCDVAVYIETDSWTNFRNQLMDGFKVYDNAKIQSSYDFAVIRQAIYKERKAEIDKDLNQDLLNEIESLKEYIKMRDEWESRR